MLCACLLPISFLGCIRTLVCLVALLPTLAVILHGATPVPLQLLRMHLLENVRVRVEAGHIDYVNELR